MSVRQCLLIKKTDIGHESRVSWIPSKFGVLGKTLKLRERGQPWDDGWKVIGAYGVAEIAPEFRHVIYSCPELLKG